MFELEKAYDITWLWAVWILKFGFLQVQVTLETDGPLNPPSLSDTHTHTFLQYISSKLQTSLFLYNVIILHHTLIH
jgi:hypothetical protein